MTEVCDLSPRMQAILAEHEVFESKAMVCPDCGHFQSVKVILRHFTAWGTNLRDKETCQKCGKEFAVLEIVEHSYETAKLDKGATDGKP